MWGGVPRSQRWPADVVCAGRQAETEAAFETGWPFFKAEGELYHLGRETAEIARAIPREASISSSVQ